MQKTKAQAQQKINRHCRYIDIIISTMKLSIIVPILFSLSCLGTISGSTISDVNGDGISSSGGGGGMQPHVMLNRHLQVATDVSLYMIVKHRHITYHYAYHI